MSQEGRMCRAVRRCGQERGSALVAVTLWLVVVGISLLLVVGITQRTIVRSRAQTAADAAALAGAVDGRAAAVHFAEANGAELLIFEADPASVFVKVQISGTAAHARASLQLFGQGVTARPADSP